MINYGELTKNILALTFVPLFFLGMFLYSTAGASERAQMPETKVGDDQHIEFNGITYINCTKNSIWDSIQCYMVINGTQILCSPDGFHSTAMNPLCAHIIIDYELDRRGL